MNANVSILKLNLATFDYYTLRLSIKSELNQIESKLMTLRQFDQSSKYLVLELAEAADYADWKVKIQQLQALLQRFNLELKFILANPWLTCVELDGKPVVALPATLKSKPIFNQTLIVEEPVRSGIRIENDGDIVVTTLVSHNAEIIATGNIHVYGDCRGRVMAGTNGNPKAKIFVARFNAELISIAGIYRALEEKLPDNLLNRAVQVFLDDKQRLNIMPLAV